MECPAVCGAKYCVRCGCPDHPGRMCSFQPQVAPHARCPPVHEPVAVLAAFADTPAFCASAPRLDECEGDGSVFKTLSTVGRKLLSMCCAVPQRSRPHCAAAVRCRTPSWWSGAGRGRRPCSAAPGAAPCCACCACCASAGVAAAVVLGERKRRACSVRLPIEAPTAAQRVFCGRCVSSLTRS